MIASKIGAALKARLASLTFTPALPVAWPNRDFVPDGDHLSAAINRIPNERLGVQAMHRIGGTLVVTVVTAVGKGSGEGDGKADAVAAHFPADLSLPLTGGGHVRIIAAPSVREGFADGGYWRTPVTIPFEVITT